MSEELTPEEEIEKLKAVIAGLEGLRGTLGDDAVDAQIAPLQDRIGGLEQTVTQSGQLNVNITNAEGGRIRMGDMVGHDKYDVGGDMNQTDVHGDQNNIDTGGGDYKPVHHHHNVPDPVKTAKEIYLKNLYARCNALPLAAMGGQQSAEQISLSQVYIALDTTTRIKLTQAEKKKRRTSRDDRPLAALEAAEKENRMVLLGGPGSGKSSFVRQLIATYAHACLNADGEHITGNPFPLFMILRDLAPRLPKIEHRDGAIQPAQKKALVQAILDQLEADVAELGGESFCGQGLQQILADGNLLLVLDGLDELAHESRYLLNLAIGCFLSAYPEVDKVIVTCRIRSYVGATQLGGFKSYTLADFDEDKIHNFVQGWYQAQATVGLYNQADCEKRTRDLQQAATNQDLQPLSSNPLLLTTMAIIHQQETTLPKQRVVLYDLAVDVLLRRWQEGKGVTLSDDLADLLKDRRRIRPLLEELAYTLHQEQSKNGGARIKWGDLLYLLEQSDHLGHPNLAREFLEYIDQKAGLLVGHGGGELTGKQQPEYDFPHRTFQEYLAGCYLVTGRNRVVIKQLIDRTHEGDYWTLASQLGFEELYHNLRQDDTLLDVAYSLCVRDWPDDVAQQRQIIWSAYVAQMLGVDEIGRDTAGIIHGPDYLELMRTHLVTLFADKRSKLTPLERAEAGRSLSRLGDPRPGVGLDENGIPDIQWGGVVPVGSYGYVGDGYDVKTAYQLAIYPVTYTQFQAFVDADDYGDDRWWLGMPEQQEAYGTNYVTKEVSSAAFPWGNHPRERVAWYQAVAFCRWLSDKLGYGVRLPHEYEWEVAARYNDGRTYPFGEEIDGSKVNYGEFVGQTTAVGLYPQGIQFNLGLHDLSGNVWEWCQNKYGNRNETDVDDSGDTRVLRGGSWYFDANYVRAAVRSYDSPDYRDSHRGFRLCRDSSPSLHGAL